MVFFLHEMTSRRQCVKPYFGPGPLSLSCFSFMDIDYTQDSRWNHPRPGTIFICLCSFHRKYWGTYLELCIWDFTWPGFPSQDIKIWLNFELHFNWWCNAFWFELKKQRIQTRINFHLSTTNASTDQVSWALLDHC